MEEIALLVSQAAEGDPEAWAQLVDRFAGLIWHIARSSGLDASDAADVSQTTWLRLAEHLDKLREPERAGAWLATTARRESIRVARLGSRQVVTDPWFALQGLEDESPEPDRALLDQEQALSVRLALAQLSPRCQEMLAALGDDPPCSYQELSERMGLPVGSIGPTRARCLDRLRDLLRSEEVVLEGPALVRRSS